MVHFQTQRHKNVCFRKDMLLLTDLHLLTVLGFSVVVLLDWELRG